MLLYINNSLKLLFSAVIVSCCGSLLGYSQTLITFHVDQSDTLIASAGNDIETLSGEMVVLGGTPAATGGTTPYSYEWLYGTTVTSADANPSVPVLENAEYILTVTDAIGCTARDEINISLDLTGISDFIAEDFSVYPNPANDSFTIESQGNDCLVSLINEAGHVLWTLRLKGKRTFEAPSIPGVYLLKLSIGDREMIRKIIIG